MDEVSAPVVIAGLGPADDAGPALLWAATYAVDRQARLTVVYSWATATFCAAVPSAGTSEDVSEVKSQILRIISPVTTLHPELQLELVSTRHGLTEALIAAGQKQAPIAVVVAATRRRGARGKKLDKHFDCPVVRT